MAKRSDGDKKGGYEVGYAKPPVATRFKKGVSGNPKGRARGSSNFHTLMMKEFADRITITTGGKTKVVTKAEALAAQLVNKAMGGDPRLLALAIGQFHGAVVEERHSRGSDFGSSEEDQQTLASFLADMAGVNPTAEPDCDPPPTVADVPDAEPAEPPENPWMTAFGLPQARRS